MHSIKFSIVVFLIFCLHVSFCFDFQYLLMSISFVVFIVLGIEVKPGKPYTYHSDNVTGKLRITQVCWALTLLSLEMKN